MKRCNRFDLWISGTVFKVQQQPPDGKIVVPPSTKRAYAVCRFTLRDSNDDDDDYDGDAGERSLTQFSNIAIVRFRRLSLSGYQVVVNCNL